MKRKTSLMLAAMLIAASTAYVQAADNMRDYQLSNGYEVEVNKATNEIFSKNYAKKYSDTAVAAKLKMTEVNIPDSIDGISITGIGAAGFVDRDEISKITLPSTIQTIGDKAFWGADSFSEITVPDSVTYIGKSAFESCDSLSSVTLGKGVKTIGEFTFKNCKNIKSLELPNSVESLGQGAFENCKSLSSLSLGNSISDIGGGAFKGCSALKDLALPNGLTVLKANTFNGCSSLFSLTLPKGLKSIENGVFGDCDSLKKIYIPATVKTISSNAFEGCENVVIYCKNGTYAQQYAIDKKIPVMIADKLDSEAPVAEESIPDHITVFVNSEKVGFKNAQPVIVEGRTLVPMRDIFEALGLIVSWDGETKTVTGIKGVTDIQLTIGKTKMLVNGRDVPLDVPAQIIDGSTMVPLRAISNSVGCKVTWDQNTRTINITD